MSNTKNNNRALLRRNSFAWHLMLAWVAGVALLAFIISGLTHPLLSWTGPQSTAFRPPQSSIDAGQVNSISSILKRHQINQAVVVKLLPTKRGVMLQITENANQARRYFDLESGGELIDFDIKQAEWLARYYAVNGDVSVPVKRVEFQTEFDDAYPWVNRLLPVYKVTFDNEQNLSVFVYTEINALAGITNTYKTRVQSVFQALHTWSWLKRFENMRVIIIASLLVCLFSMILCGIALIYLLRKRESMTRKARIHRTLAYGLWLPLLAFCLSGFWHLLHTSYSDVHRGLKLGEAKSLLAMQSAATLSQLPDTPLNHLTVVEHKGDLLYRLSIPAPRKHKGSSGTQAEKNEHAKHGEHAHHEKSAVEQRTERFKGQATEKGGIYYAVNSGRRLSVGDEEVAVEIAANHLGIDVQKINATELVTRFGQYYDFRNKRLPVWQIDADTKLGDKLFVDPATGVVVDRLVNADRYEGYSFSNLHKWSFMTPLTGRFWRDVLMVITLLLALTLAGLGLVMKAKKRKKMPLRRPSSSGLQRADSS